MTKYRYFFFILALALPVQAWASPLSDVFAPRSAPRVEYASLPVPVAIAKPVPVASVAVPAAAPEVHEPTFWERLKSLFE